MYFYMKYKSDSLPYYAIKGIIQDIYTEKYTMIIKT